MELLVLDDKFEEMGRIDLFNSLIWTRKYFQCGEFELHCGLEYFSMLDAGSYLFRKDGELGIIEMLTMEQESDSQQSLVCSGKFIESILNCRCIDKEVSFSGKHEKIARDIVKKYCIDPTDRKIPNLILGDFTDLGIQTTLQVKGEQVGDKIYEMLGEEDCSYRISYDYFIEKLIYSTWKGLNRTEEQTENSWVVFSDNYENIQDNTYKKDRTEYKNFAYVVVENKDNPFTLQVDQRKGTELRRELYITGSSSKEKEDGSQMNDAEYRESLRQQGIEELEKHKIVETFEGTVDSRGNLQYKVDYDLGDLCTCIHYRLGKVANKRITEIKEIHEDGHVEIAVTFGEDYKTVQQSMKREATR